jgi:fructokinase
MRIGIDLGGTKIELISLGDDGSVLLRRRVPTPAGDYPAILATITDLVLAAERDLARPGRVGVASPGAISPRTGVIKNSNSTALNGKPLDRDLARCLDRPVRIDNDANCLALSEAVDGAAAGRDVVFGVILGTGVGGGLVVDRKVVRGRNRIAGEWGHNPLPWADDSERPGPACYCGKSGCIETFLSGPALSRQFRARTGKELIVEEIALAAGRGDADAQHCLTVYQDRLARGLAGVVDVLDPDVIVLGGGLSNLAQLYANVPGLIGRYAFSDGVDTPIVPAAHGDSSGVRGAAWLWPPGAAG